MTHHLGGRFRPSLTWLGAALVLAGPVVWAQNPPTFNVSSSIAQVTLYPGSAKVERVAKVAAVARKLTVSCLPARAQEALDRALKSLLAERRRVLVGRGRVNTVSITLHAPQAAEVKLV